MVSGLFTSEIGHIYARGYVYPFSGLATHKSGLPCYETV